jgi:hypothetical protein
MRFGAVSVGGEVNGQACTDARSREGEHNDNTWLKSAFAVECQPFAGVESLDGACSRRKVELKLTTLPVTKAVHSLGGGGSRDK